MLKIGLTGGIGSGKSTAARHLASRGALVIDADAIARAVLRPGTPGLAAVRTRFGAELLLADGSLDRVGLAKVVFADPGALRDLEAITHPLIGAETGRQFAAAPDDGVVVHDLPLLVEKAMTSHYHLVLGVLTDEEQRVRRLVNSRGLAAADARARIASQASDADRVAACDVLIRNDGAPADLVAKIDHLWDDRIRPYAANLRARTPSALPLTRSLPTSHSDAGAVAGTGADSGVGPGPGPAAGSGPGAVDTEAGAGSGFDLAGRAARTRARLARVLGDVRLERLDGVRPGVTSNGLLDAQVGVADLAKVADPAVVDALAEAGFAAYPGQWFDHGPHGQSWPKILLGAADPGNVARLHVRVLGSPAWEVTNRRGE